MSLPQVAPPITGLTPRLPQARAVGAAAIVGIATVGIAIVWVAIVWVAIVWVAIVWGTVAASASASASAAAAPPAATTPNPADFSCVVPPLPRGVVGSSTTKLAGPAVAALTGGAARHAFSLDGGAFDIQPPRPGDQPRLSAHQAVCGAMASTAGLSGSVQQGVAVGYGRVSLAPRFFPALSGFPAPGQRAATYPTVRSFRDRLAWVVVVHTYPVAFGCPAESAPVHLTARPGDHGYEVFVVDARTGTNALVYREGGPGGCTTGARVPPSLAVAEESVSVPWKLVARDPDGYSGTIDATVLPCDQAPNTVLVDASGPNVEVRVTRPYGPPCGPAEAMPIALHAADVTADLPAVIGQDPVGLTNLLSLRPASPGTPPTTTTTSPALVPVDIATNGQTLQVAVGQVLTVDPLPGTQGQSTTSPAVSDDPAVLGPLTPGPQPLVAEFRAWKAGTAEITVPQSACVHPGSDQLPCSGSFVVTVVVH